STIGATQVAEVDAVVGDAQQAMLPADKEAVRPDMTFVSATDHELAMGQREAFPFWLSAQYDQLGVHESLRPHGVQIRTGGLGKAEECARQGACKGSSDFQGCGILGYYFGFGKYF